MTWGGGAVGWGEKDEGYCRLAFTELTRSTVRIIRDQASIARAAVWPRQSDSYAGLHELWSGFLTRIRIISTNERCLLSIASRIETDRISKPRDQIRLATFLYLATVARRAHGVAEAEASNALSVLHGPSRSSFLSTLIPFLILLLLPLIPPLALSRGGKGDKRLRTPSAARTRWSPTRSSRRWRAWRRSSSGRPRPTHISGPLSIPFTVSALLLIPQCQNHFYRSKSLLLN